MSSMFKKRGGLAFKPKAPQARGGGQGGQAGRAATVERQSQTPGPQPGPPAQAPPGHVEPERRITAQATQAVDDSGAEGAAGSAQPRGSTTPSLRPRRTPSASPELRRRSARRSTSNARESSVSSRSVSREPTVEAVRTPSRSRQASEAAVAVPGEIPTALRPSSEAPPASPVRPLAPVHGSPRLTRSASRAPSVVSDVAGPVAPGLVGGAQTSDIAALPTATVVSQPADSLVRPRAEDSLAAPRPGPAPRSRKRKQAPVSNDQVEAGVETGQQEGGAAAEPTRAPPKKRTRRPRRAAADQGDGSTAPPEGGDAAREAQAERGTAPRKERRERSVTPEDAENRKVNLQELKMADLTKDLRIGKKFSRHDELKERQRQQRAKARLEKLMPGVTEVLEQRPAAEEAPRAATVPPATPTPTAGEPSEPAPVGAASQLAAGAVAGVPQIQIVNGQIVVDQRSLVLDRHAAGAHAARGMEVIVEDEFTRLTTSNTYMKPSKQLTNHWSTADTERFYEALHRHGTEFEMIARYFPGRQRRHIKLKFNREERVNPGRINATLRMHLQRPAPINLAEFRVMSGLKLAPLEEIEAEHRRREEEHERERLRVEHETAEAARKKREALFADDPSAAASAPEATSSTSAGDAASGTTAVAAPSADGDQATGATPSQPSASALTGAAPATAGPSSSLANGTRASRSRTSRAAAAEDAATASATAAAATPSTTVEMAAAQARDEEEGPDAQLERETSDAAAADTAISEPGPSVAADDVVDSEPTTAGAALRIRGKSRGSFKPRGGRGGMATSGRGRGGATVNTRSRG